MVILTIALYNKNTAQHLYSLQSWDALNLIGVVEGPPPYILNGQDFSDSVSQFFYGEASTSLASVSVEYELGVYLNFGGKLSSGGQLIGFNLAYNHSQQFERSHKVTTQIRKEVLPRFGRNQATYIYLRPVVKRNTYKICDWNDIPIPEINARMYIYSVSDTGHDFEDFPMDDFLGNPDTHKINTWVKRIENAPEFVDTQRGNIVNRPLAWSGSGPSHFTFEQEQRNIRNTKHVVEAELGVGTDNIFKMGANTSFTYQVSEASTFNRSIGLSINYPPPRIGESNDIKRLVLRIWLFTPREGHIDKCYWISDEQNTHRPWLVAWSVDEIEIQGDSAISS